MQPFRDSPWLNRWRRFAICLIVSMAFCAVRITNSNQTLQIARIDMKLRRLDQMQSNIRSDRRSTTAIETMSENLFATILERPSEWDNFRNNETIIFTLRSNQTKSLWWNWIRKSWEWIAKPLDRFQSLSVSEREATRCYWKHLDRLFVRVKLKISIWNRNWLIEWSIDRSTSTEIN